MRLGLFGRGRLGSAVLERAANLPGLEVAWALEPGEEPGGPVDVALDVSAADAAEAHFAWALERGTDLVIGTTGWTLEPRELERRLDGRIGLLVASNFSLTVAFMARVAEAMGRFAALDPARDPYVFEHHHRLKADAPSGTALTLARAVMRGCPRKRSWALGSARPEQLSLGILRAGSAFGVHRVGLDAPAETLEITHSARSRAPFAEGALEACRWIRGRKGLFTMHDLASDLLDPLFTFGERP